VNVAVNTAEDDAPCDKWTRPIGGEKAPLIKKGQEETPPEPKDEEEPVGDRKGLIISIVTLVGSIPALIGAWCWPALVIGLLSTGAVASSARATGHYISFAITGALMIGINLYMLYGAIKKRTSYSSHWKRFGPLYCTMLAALLIMADLTRHILQDLDVWEAGPFPGSSEYRPNCEAENVTCLSLIGALFTIVFTYSGFILLFAGTMWNANLWSKLKQIKRRWRALRGKKV